MTGKDKCIECGKPMDYPENAESMEMLCDSCYEAMKLGTRLRSAGVEEDQNLFPKVEQLRDIIKGKATYDNDKEWIDNMIASIDELEKYVFENTFYQLIK